MQKAARFALVALVALLAVPAAPFRRRRACRSDSSMTARFGSRPLVQQNLARGGCDWSVRHPHDRQLGDRSRRRGPRHRRTATTRRTGSPISTSSCSRQACTGLRVMINVTGDAEMGERQQDAEPPADAALGPDDVHEDARDAVQRPLGPRHGRALVGLERAEHRALPGAAVLGQEDRRPGELREALQGGVRGHQGRQPAREGRDRRDVGAWTRQAAQRRQRQRRAGHVREAARQGERPEVRRVGASPVSRRRRTCRRCRRCATRT